MKTLTLYFTTTNGLASRLIRLIQRTPFSHVAIGVNISSLDENIIYEAGTFGVVSESFNHWEAKNKIIYEYKFKYGDKRYKEIQKFCIQQLGKPYGFTNLFSILLRRNKVIDNSNSYICSELAYIALKDKFKDLFKSQDNVTPKDLYNYLIK